MFRNKVSHVELKKNKVVINMVLYVATMSYNPHYYKMWVQFTNPYSLN
jgi:hypothetical protein